jgi:S-DNA-T family DNA segregation ATPase FtsK/SpoIIIE
VLLQSIISALVITHAPERLNLLLIDFKGGASLAMFEPLAHTVGFVTDLEGRLAERAITAIKSEIRRRKRILRETAAVAGSKVEDIHDYRAVAAQQSLPPLPNLLIVIDEFDEMVKTYADFVTELVRVVKQGRSLGVHLLLASQQPAKAVTDEIRTQLKFFIALRLGSSEDSREMMLKTDAAFLPTDIPGRAYFRVGADSELFQVAQVVGEYRAAGAQDGRPNPRVSMMRNGQERIVERGRLAQSATAQRRVTDLDVLVRALGEAGRERLAALEQADGWRPHPIWQPPLPPCLALADLRTAENWPPAGDGAMAAVWAERPEPSNWLRATVGRVDIPQESRQEPLVLPMAERHLAVVGAPGAGKTTLVRTILLSLALHHSPADLWCYAIDPGGQGLSVLAALPHLGDVVQMRDRERVRRLLHMLMTTVRERQERFRVAGVSDLPAYHRASGVRLPAILLIIDKLAMLREEFSDTYGEGTIVDDLVRLLRICRPYGVHVVITADSTRDLPYKLLNLLDQRIALRLPDLYDYSDLLGGRVSAQIPSTLPGRALCVLPEQGVLDCHIALPLLASPAGDDDGSEEQATVLEGELNDELKATAAELATAWANSPELLPPAVRLLPEQVALEDLGPTALAREAVTGTLHAPLGLESIGLDVASLLLNRDTPHALVLGQRRSGKTTALRSLAVALARRYSSEELRLVVIDPHKGGLAGLNGLPHVAHYARGEAQVAALVGVLERLKGMRPHGERWVVIVDDYNIGRTTIKSQFVQVYTGEPNLYSVLEDLATGGGELGIHLIIAANITYADDGVIKRLDEARTGVILWPNRYDPGTKLLGVGLPVGERGAETVPGRALLVREDDQMVVQSARVSDAEIAALPALVPTGVRHPSLKGLGLCLSPKAGHHRLSDTQPGG